MNWIKGNGVRRFAKVAMLLIVLQILVGVQKINSTSIDSNGSPYYVDNVWHSVFYTSTECKSKSKLLHKNFIGDTYVSSSWISGKPNYAIYQPMDSSVTFKYYIDGTNTAGDNCNKGYKFCWGNSDLIQCWNRTSSESCNAWLSKTINFTPQPTRTNIQFEISGSNCGAFIDSVKIPLANHIRFTNNDNTYSKDISSTPTSFGLRKEIVIPFRSFLLSGNKMMIKMTNGNPAVFCFNNSSDATIQTNGVVAYQFSSSNVCGIAGGTGSFDGSVHTAGNATDCNLHIWYYPSSTSNETATFELYDGTVSSANKRATFTVTAKGTNDVMSDGAPYYDGSQWYSAYYHFASYKAVKSSAPYDTMMIFPPSQYSEYGSANAVKGSIDYSISSTSAQICIGSGTAHLFTWSSSSTCYFFTKSSTNVTDTTRLYVRYAPNATTSGASYNNVKIPLATHIRLVDSSKPLQGNSALAIDKSGASVSIGGSLEIPVKFRSFHLANGKITIKMTDGDPNAFRYNDSYVGTIQSGVEIASFSQNVVCGIAGGTGNYVGSSTSHMPGDASEYDFIIKYYPTKVGNQSATFTLYDGGANGTALATITVTAAGADKSGNYQTDGSKPYYAPAQRGDGNGGTYKWYSLFLNWPSEQSLSGNSYADYDVFTPRSSNLGIIMYRNGNYASPNPAMKIYPDANSSTAYTYEINNATAGLWAYDIPTGSANAKKTRVQRYVNWTCAYKLNYNNYQIELAQHALLNDGTSQGVNYGLTTLPQSMNVAAGSNVTCTVKLRSFLTATNLKMKIVDGDNNLSDLYEIVSVGGNTVNSNEYTITECANICGFSGGDGITTFDNPGTSINTDNLAIVIKYKPSAVGTHNATLVFYDGTTERATVTLTGTATPRPQSIAWDQTLSTIYTDHSQGTEAMKLTAKAYDQNSTATGLRVQYDFEIKSSCQTNPTPTLADFIETEYDSDDNLIVKYKGGGQATIEITASQPGDGVNYAATTSDGNKTKTLIIEKVTPTVSLTADWNDKCYGDIVPMTPSRTPNVGTDNTYVYSFSGVGTGDLEAVGDDLLIKNVLSGSGVGVNVYKQADCWNNQSSTTNVTNLSFGKSTQEVVWNQTLNDIAAGDYSSNAQVITLTAYSKDTRHSTGGAYTNTWLTVEDGVVKTGLPITYTLSFEPDVANSGCTFTEGTDYTISGNTLTIIHAVAGIVTITASCAASANYSAATTDVTNTLVIDKATPAVSAVVNEGNSVTYSPTTSYTIAPTATATYYTNSDVNAFTYEIVDNSGTSTTSDVITLTDNTFTTQKAGTAYVKVTKTADCYVNAASTIVTITVDLADPLLQFTSTISSLKHTETGKSVTAASTANPASTGTITYTSSDESVATVDNSGNITTAKAGTFTVTAHIAADDKYKADDEVSATITVDKCDVNNLAIVGNNSMVCFNTQTLSYTTNNTEGHSLTWSSSDESVLTVASDGTVTAKHIGTATVTLTLAATTSFEAQTCTLSITVTKGVLEFVGTTDTDWWKSGNWNHNVVPDATNDVLIKHDCVIASSGGNALCDCLSFDNTTTYKLTINPDAVLVAAGDITSAATNLYLNANDQHQATVLFNGGTANATVQAYLKGTIHYDSQTEKNNPDWQYRGFVGTGATFTWGNVVIYYWNEANNASNCWYNNGGTTAWYNSKSGPGTGSPWTGYCMANYSQSDEHLYSYTTQLIQTNQQHQFGLTRHEKAGAATQPANCGVNLITNSWSAPIDMSDNTNVVFGDDVEQTFTFYETSNHNAYEKDSTSMIVTYPRYSGATANPNVSQYIPSGQSFLVTRTANTSTAAGAGTLTINSGALVGQASGAMYAPRQSEEFNVLGVYMENESAVDYLALLENEHCSGRFDNGYDGTKMFQSAMPQIFATNEFGQTAVNTDSTILGQRIGYRAAADGEVCTITFNTERLEGFEELYLYDRVTHKYTDILNGESYSFDGTKEGDDARFEIVGRRDDGTEYVTSQDRMIEVIGNRALLSGFAGSGETLFITDLKGNRLWTANANDGPWFDLPDLPAGMYVIYCGETSAKFIRK